jgi:hypothetical protein
MTQIKMVCHLFVWLCSYGTFHISSLNPGVSYRFFQILIYEFKKCFEILYDFNEIGWSPGEIHCSHILILKF